MIKKISIVLLVLLLGCDSESGWDCLKKEGVLIREEIALDTFEKIRNGRGVRLVIQQGEVQKVELETGENIREDVKIFVENGVLITEELSSCNFFRPYEVTTVYVTSPNLTEIRNDSPFTVESNGVLRYDKLSLISENASDPNSDYTNGDFHLELEVNQLQVVSNNISNFYISGTAQKASVGLYSGDCRFEGKNLIVQELSVYQRSSNKMFVHPIRSIKGEIRGLGDVIAYHQPPVVEVIEYYTGRLIFR